jgi:hypothetical protein
VKLDKLQQEMFSQIPVKDLFEQARIFAFDYMDGIKDRNVFPRDEAIKNMAIYDERLPITPGSPEEILE